MNDYHLHLLILISIYLILAQSFNLTFGVGRLFNLAHVSSYAMGAYATALLSTEHEWGVWACLAASVVISAIFALITAAISLRLTQDYFAIGTLAFSALISALLINWKSLTRGVLGIPGIPRPLIAGHELTDNADFLAFSMTSAVIILLLLWPLFTGRFARSLRAQAEFEEAALALGKPVVKWRTFSFMLSSALAGYAGGIFAYYINYIDPSSFSLHEMIFIFTIVIVGRPGSFVGNIIGTIFLILLPEPLRYCGFPSSILGHMRLLVYAIILFAVVFVNRRRLFPTQRTI